MRLLDLIAKKRDGGRHSPEEIAFLARCASDQGVPDYQLAAWLMAVFCRGMDFEETAELTKAMAASGRRFDFSGIPAPKVDKHSTGGVGDGISLVLAPLAAEAGLIVPMMSGRGLGHPGGTLDKLESIPGLRVRLSMEEVTRQLSAIGVAMFGQSQDLAPADGKFYRLRDATATVPSLPLITASILSKKLAEGLDSLVLDVKVGSGAFFAKKADAKKLAHSMVKTAKLSGLKAIAVLTDMDQPLGRAVGNACEMRQAIEILQGDLRAADYVECLLVLGGWMLALSGKARSAEAGVAQLEKILESGAAAARLKKMIEFQGGDSRVVADPDLLTMSPLTAELKAPRAGFISRLDALLVGQASVLLGAGRAKAEDSVDFGAGLMIEKKAGDRVEKGQAVLRLYANDQAKLAAALERLKPALEITPRPPKSRKIILETIR
jgi:pyrimidine-nucleoside phosphorylase